ncbi:hypothetical protein EX30DRAFT_315949 [Ascodesmis nigricans]|uniref:Small ribosomal subunit protein uS5m n=1 Tax=Ascodesmis nigricans TaxID=341454 RepID=A0A4S2N4R2_9PEZI|nr:hypothetical protein EX30DRAFT_315949 [Ascodesmis nigricans]
MSASRPLHRLLAHRAGRPTSSRCFSSTPTPQFPRQITRHIKPTKVAPAEKVPSQIKAYTSKEYPALRQKYTEQQLLGLMAAERAIDHDDFDIRRPRREGDPFALSYVSDFTKIDPVLDFPTPERIENWIPGMPTDTKNVDPRKVRNIWNDKEKLKKIKEDGYFPELGQFITDSQPEQPLPEIQQDDLKYKDEDDGGEADREYLSHLTNFSLDTVRGLMRQTMVTHMVTNQTRMGKIRKQYVLVAVGNGDGVLGIGEGKAIEFQDAQKMALWNAERNIVPIPRYQKRTTFGDIEIKNGAVEMKIFTRPPGFGVRCSPLIFDLCRLSGIKDLNVRVTRSRNPMNVIKTFCMALQKQTLPEQIARARGIKFVDVRKVYFNGQI